MANAFDVLQGLVAQVPDSLKPVIAHIGNMLKHQSDALVAHVGDNNETYAAITNATSQLEARIGAVEGGAVAINATIVEVSKKLEGLDATLTSSAALEASPVVKGIRDDITALKVTTDEVVSTVTGIRADIMKPEMFEAIPTFINIKSELTALDLEVKSLAAGVGHDSPPGLHPGSSADFAATIASAVAGAIRRPEGDSEGWSGVAGSRLFTQRVKEYRGPMSEFSSWAQTFKSNIPKPMREAIEWAENEKDPITEELITARSMDRWNEETWRCLAGVLKGNSETLMNTLEMGKGLELWRQLCAAHVMKTPEHADKLHQALNKLEPARNLSEVRHKINIIMAGISKHDSMTDEKMQEGSKRALIMRILPVEIAKHLALQRRAKNSAELVDNIGSYLTDMGSFEMSQGNMPMELCELNLDISDAAPVATNNSAIAKIQAQVEELSAFVRSAPPIGPGKGATQSSPWQSFNGGSRSPGKGQFDKGKGKGKGKGKPTSNAIASRRAEKNGSQALCPTEARTGRCDYEARTGRRCKFLHVKLPKELSGIEGLIRSDLGELRWDSAESCYLCTDELDKSQLPDFIAHVEAEVANVTAELMNESAELGF